MTSKKNAVIDFHKAKSSHRKRVSGSNMSLDQKSDFRQNGSKSSKKGLRKSKTAGGKHKLSAGKKIRYINSAKENREYKGGGALMCAQVISLRLVTYKDSVFVDLFYEDETSKKNLLSLYNALHDTDYQDESAIHKVRIGTALYKNFKNDISFEMNGKVLVFGEHQSTVNLNMPLRCLMYTGRIYEQLIDTNARYRKKLIHLPAPEFYTFYNGTEDYPLEQELTLSDAYLNPAQGNTVDLKVKVININTDKSHGILEKCGVLKEYSQFIDTVRKYPNEQDSIKRAVNECIDHGILTDYLKRRGSEVTNMFFSEYSYEDELEVTRQEAFETGEEKGIILAGKIFQEMKDNPHLTNRQIAKNVGCTIKTVKRLRKSFMQ